MSENYRDLMVPQKAKKLASQAQLCRRRFARGETHALSAQKRRAAISVRSNIAESKGRRSHKEVVQFLYRGSRSMLEIETQIPIVRDLDYIEGQSFGNLEESAAEVGRLLNGVIRRVEREIELGAPTPNT